MSVIYKNGTYYGTGGGGEGADTEIIADDFDPTESYAVGDYVVYEGTLYKCTIAHTGAWDASDFDATQVMAEMQTPMPAADMSDIVTPLPGVMSRRFKYSTEEQVVGTWIDGKPIYQKSIIVPQSKTLTKETWTTVSDLEADGIENAAELIDFTFISDRDNAPIVVYTVMGRISISSNKAYFQLYANTTFNIGTGPNFIVTIQYTKTTD